MAFDGHKNFADSTVAIAPSPADLGNQLQVQPGEGALFPNAPFNAPAIPPGVKATLQNSEIVRVTAIDGDTLTIIRAQEGTSAKKIGVGWFIGDAITAKTLTDIEQSINNSSVTKGFAIGMAVGLS
jgi:hypothetical protein